MSRSTSTTTAVTFVLPGPGRAGGTGTTAEMAQRLRELGFRSRVACRVPRPGTRAYLRAHGRRLLDRLMGISHNDWLAEAEGVVYYHALEQLEFEPGEVVIAVGSWTIEEVHRLEADVLKLRWCKGFNENLPELIERSWAIPMATVVVSAPLIARVEAYAGHGVLAVTPNGIDTSVYYTEERERDGVGAIYRLGWKKAPEVLVATMGRLAAELPALPRYVFGTERLPSELKVTRYWRYPSRDQAREIYNRARVWLIPSRSEGFGNPILEAMACGAVVVSTAHDSAPGLIDDGVNGFLVPIGDVDAFVEKVRWLCSDEPARLAARHAALETVKRFSWESAAERMAAAIRTVVAEGDRPTPFGHRPPLP